MACQITLHMNLFASPVEMDTVPYADQEYIQRGDGYLKFTRMCSFVVERGDHWRYLENLLSLKHRLCRHGSHLVTDLDTGCRVSLDLLQIEDIIHTLAMRVERMAIQNSHREKIPFVATCDVIVSRNGQLWQRGATTGSVDLSDFGVFPTTKLIVDLIEKRKRNEDFDDDNLKLEMGLEQLAGGCKRSRAF